MQIKNHLDVAYGESFLSYPAVKDWVQLFKFGRESLDDEPHLRRQLGSVTFEANQLLLQSNQWKLNAVWSEAEYHLHMSEMGSNNFFGCTKRKTFLLLQRMFMWVKCWPKTYLRFNYNWEWNIASILRPTQQKGVHEMGKTRWSTSAQIHTVDKMLMLAILFGLWQILPIYFKEMNTTVSASYCAALRHHIPDVIKGEAWKKKSASNIFESCRNFLYLLSEFCCLLLYFNN